MSTVALPGTGGCHGLHDFPETRYLPRRYRPVRLLGRGGEGMVLEVHDLHRGGERLALKLLPGNLARGLDPERLRREFRIQSRLAHPALARVRDFGLLSGAAGVYFTTELFEGTDLLSWFIDHPIEKHWPAAVAIAAQVLGALHAVHRAGFFHGDIKPSNLLVSGADTGASGAAARRGAASQPPRVKLIDFGGAGLAAGTPPGAALPRWSTPAYGAPRALRGDGAQEDLFALGLTLHQAFTGKLPFELGDREARERWQESGRPARLSDWVDDPPPGLESLIARLTGAETRERFGSAFEALQHLGQSSAADIAVPRTAGMTAVCYGREAELSGLIELLAGSPPAAGSRVSVCLLAAPPGLGKSRLLEEALARFQLQGWKTALIRRGEAARGLGELAAAAEESPGALAPPGAAFGMGASAAAAMEGRAALLFDRLAGRRILAAIDDWPLAEDAGDEEPAESDAHRLLDGLIEIAASRPAGAPGPRFLIASSRPECFRARFGAFRDRIAERHLEPLAVEAVRNLAEDIFQTDGIPDDLPALLHRASAGRPRRILERLNLLAAGGVTSDFLGFLKLPSDWKERIEGPEEPEGSPAVHDQPAGGREDRVLAILEELEGLAVTPDEAQRFLGRLDPELSGTSPVEWQELFLALYHRGALLREAASPPPRYRIPAGAQGGSSRRGRLPGAVRDRIPAALLGALEAGSFRPRLADPDTAVPLCRLALRAGRPELALKLGRLAARQLRRRERHHEAIRLLGEIELALPREEPGSRPARCLALRRAHLCRLAGAAGPGLAALEAVFRGPAGDSLDRRALFLRSALLEESGKPEGAAGAVEVLVASLDPREERRGAGTIPSWWFLARARSAALCFSRGDARLGQEALGSGRDLLELTAKMPPGGEKAAAADLEGYADALGLFGRIHSAHGDQEAAILFLSRSSELARAAGRRDLEEGPLHELATLFARRRRFDEAEEAFLSSQRLAERRGDRLAKLRVLVNRATLRYRAGSLEQAESLYREARGLSDSIGPNRCMAPIFIGLEAIARDRGDFRGALRLLRRITREGSGASPEARINALHNLGDVYLHLGRPARALLTREAARASAGKLGNPVLIRRGHAGVAAIRIALGMLEEAGEDLEQARAGAPDADDRLVSWIQCLEGTLLLASRSGDALRGVCKRLAAAREAARANRDRANFELSSLLLIGAHVRRGEREQAAQALDELERELPSEGSGRSGIRMPWLLAAYRAICRGNARRAEGELADLLQRAAASGRIWEAIQVGLEALEHLQGEARSQIRPRLEELAGRFLRRVSPETAARFRAVFLPDSDAPVAEDPEAGRASAPAREPGFAPDSSNLARLALRWSGLRTGDLRSEGRLEGELERLRVALGLRGLWILNDPGSLEPLVYAAAGCRELPIEAFTRHREALERAHRDRKAVWSRSWFLIPIPHPLRRRRRASPRILYGVLSAGAPRGRRDAAARRESFIAAAGLAGLLLRLGEYSEALATARRRGKSQAHEIRLLNARVLREKSQLDTEAISRQEVQAHVQRVLDAAGSGPDLQLPVARSPAMHEMLQHARRLAESNIPILLLGEPGTGKDTLARVIHTLSPRASQPFLSEVCLVPESLLESELFGAVKGSFTGADADRPGLLLGASGGTLYLDRIEEMSPALQARLLRAIEERRVRPVGGEAAVPIDVRLVSSSRLRLEELEAHPTFRRDLFFRVQGAVLEIPPLRNRRDDIPELFRQFLERHARDLGLPLPEILPGVDQRLKERNWPGNLRELENETRRVLLERPSRLHPDHFDPAPPASTLAAPDRPGRTPAEPAGPGTGMAEGPPASTAGLLEQLESGFAGGFPALQDIRERLERWLILEALRRCRGNATRAAGALGISRRYLGTLLSRYEIKPRDLRRRV